MQGLNLTALDGAWDPASLLEGDLNTELLASLPETPGDCDLSLTDPVDLDFDLEDVFSSISALTPDPIDRQRFASDESGESSGHSVNLVPALQGLQTGMEASAAQAASSGALRDKGQTPTSSSGRVDASDSSTYREPGGGSASGAAAQHTERKRSKSPGEDGPEEDDVKRAIRMARNRENAHLSRQRKKAQMASLEQQCGVLTQQVRALTGLLGQLSAENGVLRAHLEATCAAARVPLPAGLPAPRQPQLVVMPPAAAGAAPTVALALVPKDASPPGLVPPVPGPFPAAIPGAPLPLAVAPFAPPQPQPQQPAFRVQVETPDRSSQEAVTPQSSQQASGADAQATTPRRASKRRRGVVAGSSAAFLALFSVFLIASSPSALFSRTGGGQAPAVVRQPLTTGGASSLLPVASSWGLQGGALQRQGRALQGLSTDEAGGLHDTGCHEAEDQRATSALQGALTGLAPLVLAMEPVPDQLDLQSTVPNLAASIFEGWGLDPPRSCRRLQTFENRQGAPDAVAPELKRELIRYLKGELGLRGRGPNAVPLSRPPQRLLALPDPRATAVAPAGGSPAPKALPHETFADAHEVDEDDVTVPEVAEPILLTAVVPAGNLSSASFLPARPKAGTADNDSALVVLTLEPGRRLSVYACDLLVKGAGASAGCLMPRLF